MISVDQAIAIARHLLAADLPQRWLHVQAVGERAAAIRHLYRDGALLVVAAYLHDIGYAPRLRRTGFHPFDGAHFLRSIHVDERVVGLVAHHSCSCMEACFHRLDRRLQREFPRDDSLPHDALLYCDLTTGPAGQSMTLDERLADIRLRYDADSTVVRFIGEAEGEFRAAVARVEARLAVTRQAVAVAA